MWRSAARLAVARLSAGKTAPKSENMLALTAAAVLLLFKNESEQKSQSSYLLMQVTCDAAAARLRP
jgi:hypothetical protein